MKVRKLTPEERAELRSVASDWFKEDAYADTNYAVETALALAEGKDDAWWVEFLSSDPEAVREFLSFDPFAKG